MILKTNLLLQKKDPLIYISDFKCGEDIHENPIRWNYEDMLNGYKIIDGRQYNFTDCLLMKNATIKLDIITFINNNITEISDNYFIKIGSQSNYSNNSTEYIKKSLIEDYNKNVDKKNYFKALKRLFSIYRLINRTSDKLISLFNSGKGMLYKVICDLKTIVFLLEQTFKKPPIQLIINNLQNIKYFASKITEFRLGYITPVIDNICNLRNNHDMFKHINELIERLNNDLNKHCANYLVKL